MKYANLGSVSRGTMRTEDLLDAFAAELEYQLDRNKNTRGINKRSKRTLIREARAVDPETDEASRIVDELFVVLDEFAPPYAYFGSVEGDGADYGYWPAIYTLQEDLKNGEIANATFCADDYRGLVVDVNDHGNVTLYNRTSRNTWRVLWSCV